MYSSLLLLFFFVSLFYHSTAWFSSEEEELSENDDEIDEILEFQHLTCSSAIKLFNKNTKTYLHSHQVTYGSGSRQQSVTGFQQDHDPNSYWIIREPHANMHCTAGEPIACGSLIRLQHLQTQKFLHSHLHRSPLSHNQEVSAFLKQNNQGDTGDNWKVVCSDSSSVHWAREGTVQLIHQDTGKYLSTSSQQYGHPIPGQHEIAAIGESKSPSTLWIASRGVYFGVKQSFDH